jgi:hypothetical protein
MGSVAAAAVLSWAVAAVGSVTGTVAAAPYTAWGGSVWADVRDSVPVDIAAVQTWSGAPEPSNGGGDEFFAESLLPHAPRNNNGMKEAAVLSGVFKHVLENIRCSCITSCGSGPEIDSRTHHRSTQLRGACANLKVASEPNSSFHVYQIVKGNPLVKMFRCNLISRPEMAAVRASYFCGSLKVAAFKDCRSVAQGCCRYPASQWPLRLSRRQIGNRSFQVRGP